MSCRKIDITTAEGNELTLLACRQVRHRAQRIAGPLSKVVGWTKTTTVAVQYGVGIGGEGRTLKEAMTNFRASWSEFCASRAA